MGSLSFCVFLERGDVQFPREVPAGIGQVSKPFGGGREGLKAEAASCSGEYGALSRLGACSDKTWLCPQPRRQPTPPLRHLRVMHCNANRLARADENTQLFSPCDGGVKQVALEHQVVLSEQRHDDGGELRSLGFVDARRESVS